MRLEVYAETLTGYREHIATYYNEEAYVRAVPHLIKVIKELGFDTLTESEID